MSQQGRLRQDSIESLTGDTGGAVFPDASDNINIVGGDTTVVNGNPGTNTLTIDASSSGYPITPFVVGTSGQAGYQTIQAALDAANTAGGGTVYVQPGTYTEDLTLYDNVTIIGSTSQVDDDFIQINGTHTPPTTGTIGFYNLWFADSTAIFSSAAAGTTTINMFSCITAVTNGYTFDLLNWTGLLNLFDFFVSGTNDGFVNNTGGAPTTFIDVGCGNGSANSMILSGINTWILVQVFCPLQLTSTSESTIDNAQFSNTVTIQDTSLATITQSRFSTGANSALSYTTNEDSTFTQCVFDTSASPALDGGGFGTLTLTDCSFLDNAVLGGSLTLGSGSRFYPVEMGNGELLIGSAGQPAVAATLASAGGTITITNGAGTINLEAVAAIPTTFDTDSGSAVPIANNLDIVGTAAQGISTSGATNIVTITAADASTTQKGVIETSTDAESIAGSSTTVSVTPASLGAKLGTQTSNGLAYGGGTSAAVNWLAEASDGQLPIGNTGSPPTLATLTAGVGITITNGSGSITIDADNGAMDWNEITVTGPTAMAVDNGYIANNAGVVGLTLPATASIGDIIKIDGKGAGGWSIGQNAGQTIHFLSQDTTTGAGGSLASTGQYDCITLRCITANTDFVVETSVGNITVT